MRGFIEELKAAVAGLGRAPAFTALAVGVLGLGLAAVIFMYGVADTLMMKPPPYPNADRLYTIATIDGQIAGDYDDSMVPQDYLKVREAANQFEAIGAIYVGTTYLTGDGQAERYDGGFADGHVFDVAGVAPELGRTILPRDAMESAAPVVVLSHKLWTERFGADPAVIGRTVRVNGKSSEVIGVMPEGFTFPSNASLWVANQQDATRLARGEAVDVGVFGRLRADGDLDVARQELAPVAAAITAEAGPQAFNGHFEIVPFAAGFIGDEGATLVWTLVIAVGFVLLIACANVSNLLLARSAYRVRETTVRSALGASRGRLVMHMLAEGFVISALATLLGLLLASIALDGMQLAMARLMQDSPSWWRFEVDYRAAAVAVAAALLSTLIAGLPAAIRASRPSLDALLRDGGRTGTGLAIGKIAWALVVFEVALACLLLGVSALMTKSVLIATSTDVGVETGDIMTARVGLTAGTYPEDEEQVRFWGSLVERIQAQPGIHAAAVATSLPGHGSGDGPISVEGRDYGDVTTKPFVNHVTVSPSYFETFRISVRQGRVIDSRDNKDSLPAIVINEKMVRDMFPDESPLGKRLSFDFDVTDKTWFTVIGVVPDIVQEDSGEIKSVIYIPVTQRPERFMSIMVRGEGDPRSLVSAVRTALAQTDADLALYWPRTFDESRMIRTAGFRIIGTMFAVFAVVALVLAAAGLFGVLAFHVGQRTREIGVRRALGADDRRILRMVMRASGVQIALGVAIGMALMPLMGRGLGDILGEVSPYDPGVYSMVVAIMIVVAVAATLTPTRRALKVDPAAALRYE
ncbi:MAG TPA: ADOP family duplicated permease [Steroidobacteraceae bacterium]|nr:ADOP family duplicated permease [Steroidobacteraceae bacterium]